MKRITNPAARVVTKCGNGDFSKGCTFVAASTGLTPARVRRWTYSKKKGGTGGLVPAEHQALILMAAQAAFLELTAGDFFPTETEREAMGLTIPPRPEVLERAAT